MTIGPEPMMRTRFRSVRRGIGPLKRGRTPFSDDVSEKGVRPLFAMGFRLLGRGPEPRASSPRSTLENHRTNNPHRGAQARLLDGTARRTPACSCAEGLP